MSKKNLISCLTSLILYVLVVSVLGDLFVAYIVPQFEFSYSWLISVFFVVLYSSALYFIYKLKNRRSTDIIMLFKTLKLIISILFLLVGSYVFTGEVKLFLITFLAYYLLLLIPEIYFGLLTARLLERVHK